jgi:monoamine oxidase
MNQLGPSNTFYSLRGGLDQVIERMREKVIRKGVVIQTGAFVKDIVYDVKQEYFTIGLQGTGKKQVEAKVCVCAIPKQAALQIPFFKPVEGLLKKVECGTLCRIYSVFDKGADGKVWFHDLPKLTVKNALRMVIPYDTERGVIMISYSDNYFADEWNHLYEKEGVRAVNRRLQALVKESLGIQIPVPKNTQVFYWGCGVGYWGVGVDSEVLAESLTKPFDKKPFDKMNLYLCGEHYSSSNQQWMEGALDTVERMLYSNENNDAWV